VPGGHIGRDAGSGASKGTWPKVESWIAARRLSRSWRDDILFHQQGGLGIAALNRPKALNALTAGYDPRLDRQAHCLGGGRLGSCGLLRGEGRAFCAGGDVRLVHASRHDALTRRLQRRSSSRRVPLHAPPAPLPEAVDRLDPMGSPWAAGRVSR